MSWRQSKPLNNETSSNYFPQHDAFMDICLDSTECLHAGSSTLQVKGMVPVFT